MSSKDETENAADTADDHLDGLEDGAGCTEIWEKLSENREKETQ